MFRAKVYPADHFEQIQIFYTEEDSQRKEEERPECESIEELQFEMDIDTSFVDENEDISIRSCHEFPTKFSSPLNPSFRNTRKNAAPKHVNILHLRNKIRKRPDLRKKAVKNATFENDLTSVLSNLALIEE